jgi:Bacterial PH domain
MAHFPELLRELPPFDGPFDAFKLEAKNCDVLFASYPGGAVIPPHSHDTDNVGVITEIEFWFHAPSHAWQPLNRIIVQRTYGSKIDGFVVLALGGLLLALGLAIGTVVTHPTPQRWLVLLVLGPLAIGLPLWTLLTTRYAIDDAFLHVRSGPFRWTIPLRDIGSITPTRDITSSPALSLDRLCIEYGDGRRLLVSPREKDAFLRDLQERRARAR